MNWYDQWRRTVAKGAPTTIVRWSDGMAANRRVKISKTYFLVMGIEIRDKKNIFCYVANIVLKSKIQNVLQYEILRWIWIFCPKFIHIMNIITRISPPQNMWSDKRYLILNLFFLTWLGSGTKNWPNPFKLRLKKL